MSKAQFDKNSDEHEFNVLLKQSRDIINFHKNQFESTIADKNFDIDCLPPHLK